jgi:hypothetical protein
MAEVRSPCLICFCCVSARRRRYTLSIQKAIRKWRDETQLHLEFKSGIGQGYLSELESGRRR